MMPLRKYLTVKKLHHSIKACLQVFNHKIITKSHCGTFNSVVLVSLNNHLVIFIIYMNKVKENWFCIPYKTHSRSNKHGSISFMIDNMHYVILRIWEQDSVPWCGKIQNKRLEVLGNTFNLHSNSTLRSRSVVSQSVSKGE